MLWRWRGLLLLAMLPSTRCAVLQEEQELGYMYGNLFSWRRLLRRRLVPLELREDRNPFAGPRRLGAAELCERRGELREVTVLRGSWHAVLREGYVLGPVQGLLRVSLEMHRDWFPHSCRAGTTSAASISAGTLGCLMSGRRRKLLLQALLFNTRPSMF